MTTSTEINFHDIAFLDKQIENLLQCKPLSEVCVKALCERAKEIL